MEETKPKKQKKAFKDTGFGKFLNKAAGAVPALLPFAANLLPAGGFIGDAIEVAEKILTADASPEAQAHLRELQSMKFEWMKEVMLDEREAYRMEIEDRSSARQREVALVQAGDKNWTQNILAFVGVAFNIAVVFYLLVYGISSSQEDDRLLIGTMVGSVSTIGGVIFSYYFGSSRDSRKKTDILARSQPPMQ